MIQRERGLRVGASALVAVAMGLTTSLIATRPADAADAGSAPSDAGADAPAATPEGDEYLRSLARRLLENSDIVKAGRDLLDGQSRAAPGAASGGAGTKGGTAGTSGTAGAGAKGGPTGAGGTAPAGAKGGPTGSAGGPGAKGGVAGTSGAAPAGAKGSPSGASGATATGGNGGALATNGASGANGAGSAGGANGANGAAGPGSDGGPLATKGGVGANAGGDASALDGLPGSGDATGAAVDDAGADGAAADDAGADEAATDAATDTATAVADDAATVERRDAATAAPGAGSSGGAFGGDRDGARGAPKSGDPMEMKGATDSPLTKLGIPAKAVPAVATAAAAGAMAIWPAIAKTLTGLLKKLLAAKLKDRAKKGEKLDASTTTYRVLGMPVRPAELASIAVAALVYGLAISYTFQGFRMQRGFVLSQETLVLLLFYFRGFVRVAYERAFKLTTQYRFWIMGGVLCLGTAYLGNPLGTVGFELEAAKTPEQTRRALRLKAVLVAIGFAMAIGFFVWNRVSPGKLLQSGRVMMSGAALAEILPIAPMPGRKILAYSKPLWLLMFAVIVPGFFVLNFVR